MRIKHPAIALSILILTSILPLRFLGPVTPNIPAAQATTVPIKLFGDANLGWNGSTTNPNPTITVHGFDTVTLSLTSSDKLAHEFLLDADGDGAGDTADCPSVDPCSATFSGTISYSFSVANIPVSSSYTYFCVIHPFSMFGTFVISPDFSISANPTSTSISAGSFGTSTITLNSKGFTGTVSLASAVAPSTSTITTTLKPASVALASGGTGTSTLNVTTTTFTPLGTYTVTVTGASGSLSHSTPVTAMVTSSTVGGSSLYDQRALPFSLFGLSALILVMLSLTGIYARHSRRLSQHQKENHGTYA